MNNSGEKLDDVKYSQKASLFINNIFQTFTYCLFIYTDYGIVLSYSIILLIKF